MKLIKGVIIGSAVTAAAYMLCTDEIINKKRITKQVKKWIHKMGVNC